MTSPASSASALLDELTWRGLLHSQTEGAAAALAAGTSVAGYCGFDPTADSLHVGSLVPIMGLVRLQRAGHRPVALVGGGTGLIGDPSGKANERALNSAETVAGYTAGIRAQLERLVARGAGSDAPPVMVRDNGDWLRGLGAIDLLRDVGKHFSVNVMLARESVKSRLDTGISFTEFSYMLLQAYDFLELYRRDGVTLQIGGSDQWGNILAGTDLIRRVTGGEAHGLTMPLVTTAAGTKFGKSEAGAIWLDAARTSPYRFWQFWVNADDRDAGKWLRYFTLLGREEIKALDAATASDPSRRDAQHALADAVTAFVHSEQEARTAREVSTLLFGKADASTLSGAALSALANEVPFAEVPSGADGTLDALDLAERTALVPSRGQAKRVVEQGGLYVNGRRVSMADRMIGSEGLLPGGHLLLRKGARDYALVRVLP
jgi:tyrosyl-tRNA synthetase